MAVDAAAMQPEYMVARPTSFLGIVLHLKALTICVGQYRDRCIETYSPGHDIDEAATPFHFVEPQDDLRNFAKVLRLKIDTTAIVFDLLRETNRVHTGISM